MAPIEEDVYATLVMSDSYMPGAVVLAHSLRDGGTSKKLAALVTLDTLSPHSVTELKELYDFLIPVDRIPNPRPANLYVMGRPDLLFAFSKIALWRLTQFRKIVYLDADVVALRAPDELFELDHAFAAAPDIGWPDAFNTGVMVIKPDMGEYWALRTLASSGDSFDGADQGLLNQYYENRRWHRISFTYNCTPNAQYQWEPAYRYYKSRISLVHFIGKDKPWLRPRDGGGGSTYTELLGRWWAVADRHRNEPRTQQPEPTSHFTHHEANAIQKQTEQPPSSVEHQAGRRPADSPTDQPDQHLSESHQGQGQSSTASFEAPRQEHHHADPSPPPSQAVEHKPFSAPQMEWDATRHAPPTESKPEAANFPTQTYDFNRDKGLFHAPQNYPEPPKNMWYEVPPTKPAPQERPKPIFPWEGRSRPGPTRVFAEDSPPPPLPSLHPEVDSPPPLAPTIPDRDSPGAPSTSTSSHEEPSQPFAPTVNRWDTVPGIERYVRAVRDAQVKRTARTNTSLLSPGAVEELLASTGAAKSERQARRESLILTDFPTAIERPSLPVTPAPIRRTMWGEDKETSELAAAEGVPDQADWNPAQSLENLRRASLLEFEHLQSSDKEKKGPPSREMPTSAAPLSGSPATSPSLTTPNPPTSAPSSENSSSPAIATATKPSASAEPSTKSVKPSAPTPIAPSKGFSVATLEAEVTGNATSGSNPGRLVFSEPDFGPGSVKSEHSIEAEAYIEGEGMMSPMEGAESP